MATWSHMNRFPFVFTRICCNAGEQVFKVRAQALSFHLASRNHLPTRDDTRDVDLAVTRDSETIVCFHPTPDVAYELTKPIPNPDPKLDSAETHDLVLKSKLKKEILQDKKTPAVEELAKMFYTTKHRWYPVGQYHTRRRDRNPPKDR